MRKSIILLSCCMAVMSCEQNDVTCKETREAESVLRYLSVAPSYWQQKDILPTDTNYINLCEAIGRMTCIADNGHVSLNNQSLSEVHMSATLYDFIVHEFNQESTRGMPFSVSQNPNDCVACTVAANWSKMARDESYVYQMYQLAWKRTCQVYSDKGVPLKPVSNLKTFLRDFFRSVEERLLLGFREDMTYGNSDDSRPYAAYIGVVKIEDGKYHCVTITKITGDLVFFRDDQGRDIGLTSPVSLSYLMTAFLVRDPMELEAIIDNVYK